MHIFSTEAVSNGTCIHRIACLAQWTGGASAQSKKEIQCIDLCCQNTQCSRKLFRNTSLSTTVFLALKASYKVDAMHTMNTFAYLFICCCCGCVTNMMVWVLGRSWIHNHTSYCFSCVELCMGMELSRLCLQMKANESCQGWGRFTAKEKAEKESCILQTTTPAFSLHHAG